MILVRIVRFYYNVVGCIASRNLIILKIQIVTNTCVDNTIEKVSNNHSAKAKKKTKLYLENLSELSELVVRKKVHVRLAK